MKVRIVTFVKEDTAEEIGNIFKFFGNRSKLVF